MKKISILLVLILMTVVSLFSMTKKQADDYVKYSKQKEDRLLEVRDSKYGSHTWKVDNMSDPNYAKWIEYTKKCTDLSRRRAAFDNEMYEDNTFITVGMETIGLIKKQCSRVAEKMVLDIESMWGDIISFNYMGFLKSVMRTVLETHAENWVTEVLGNDLQERNRHEYEMVVKNIFDNYLKVDLTPAFYINTSREAFTKQKKKVLYASYKATEKIAVDNSKEVLEIYQKIQNSKSIVVRDNMGRVVKNSSSYSKWAGTFARYADSILSTVDFTDIMWQNVKLYTKEADARQKLRDLKNIHQQFDCIENYSQALDYYNQYAGKIIPNYCDGEKETVKKITASMEHPVVVNFTNVYCGDTVVVGCYLKAMEWFNDDAYISIAPVNLPLFNKHDPTRESPQINQWYDKQMFYWNGKGWLQIGDKTDNIEVEYTIPADLPPGNYHILMYPTSGESPKSQFQSEIFKVEKKPDEEDVENETDTY